MNLPRQIESIEHNYHEDAAMIIVEKYFDEWSKDEDWWHGTNEIDVNVWNDEDDREIWHVFVCGLVRMDDGYYETDTNNEIDKFTFKLGEEYK